MRGEPLQRGHSLAKYQAAGAGTGSAAAAMIPARPAAGLDPTAGATPR